jgi:hypothetical protein
VAVGNRSADPLDSLASVDFGGTKSTITLVGQMKRKVLALCFALVIVPLVLIPVVLYRRVERLNGIIAHLREENANLSANLTVAANHLSNIAAENKRLSLDRSDVPRLRGEVTQLRKELRAAVESPHNIERAQAEFQSNYRAWIPGLGSLGEEEWSKASALASERGEDLAGTMGEIRKTAVKELGRNLQGCLKTFMEQNDNQFPVTLQEFSPYLSEPIRSEARLFCTMTFVPGQTLQIRSLPATRPNYTWNLEITSASYRYLVRTAPNNR